jgi:chromosome segregation ATPase
LNNELAHLQSCAELLRSYRIAHARAVSIEPFEKTLKENTPLVSISEPGAFVEFLNQLTLRGDMVMDELKRVTSDRDDYKKKFEEAQKQAAAAQEELNILKSDNAKPLIEPPIDNVTVSPTNTEPTPVSIKSPVSSVLGIFSPKQTAQAVPEGTSDASESFFSYDEEVPQLQSDLKAKSAEIIDLKEEVKTLQESLGVAKETNESLSESLQSLDQQLREAKDPDREAARNGEIHDLQQRLEMTTKEMENLKVKIAEQEKTAKDTLTANTQALNDSKGLADKLKEQLKDLQVLKDAEDVKIKHLEQQVELLNGKIDVLEAEKKTLDEMLKKDGETPSIIEPASPLDPPATASAPSKKKNKKKKKGANAIKDAPGATKADDVDNTLEHPSNDSAAAGLLAEISKLKEEVAARDVQIEKLQTKRKTEEDLREEIENMQDNLVNIGQEHVEAKEKIKDLQAEKKALQEKLGTLEQELNAQSTRAHSAEKLETDLQKISVEYEDLKIKCSTLQVDLGAAQQLASSRYKDLTDLRDVLQKAQPELKSLRSENASLKTAKDELTARTAELRRLEGREKDLKSDLASFKKQAADREAEIKTLNEKVTQEMNGRLRAEEQSRVAGRDLRRAEADKIEISANGERAQRELSKVQDEAAKLRTMVQDLEIRLSKLTIDNEGLREEINLKSSQYASAQSLVGSMRDQTSEMATQLKEAKEQAESLEEELGEVQRLLSERTREGETMRRLLSDVDERADNKVREMRERMEAAIEERDRAEDEASTTGRRRAREIEDLKNKIRDAERELKRANDDREELQHSEKEWKRRREELEKTAERATQEVTDINKAMEELRDALDESGKQAREAEKQKTDLRRLLDDANQKYEKLQKSLKLKQQRLDELTSTNSSRSSMDRDSSPMRAPNGGTNGMMDYVYLKTVLLQFLEQRDKKLQAQLVPVLGKLLHFDK